MFRCSKWTRTYCWKIQPCINNINIRNSRGLNKLLQRCWLICVAIRRTDHQPGVRSKESSCFLQHYRVAFILCITILSGKMSLKRFQLHTMEDMQVLNKLPLTISRITCIGAILCMTGLLWNQHTTPKRTFIKWSFERIWINLKDSLWIPRMGKWFWSWYNVRLCPFFAITCNIP